MIYIMICIVCMLHSKKERTNSKSHVSASPHSAVEEQSDPGPVGSQWCKTCKILFCNLKNGMLIYYLKINVISTLFGVVQTGQFYWRRRQLRRQLIFSKNNLLMIKGRAMVRLFLLQRVQRWTARRLGLVRTEAGLLQVLMFEKKMTINFSEGQRGAKHIISMRVLPRHFIPGMYMDLIAIRPLIYIHLATFRPREANNLLLELIQRWPKLLE